MEVKFFGLFQVLYPVKNQVYKFKLLKKYRIYNIFYMSLIVQNTIRKEQVNKNMTNFKVDSNDKKYKGERI